ncbi:MAG: alpha/beta fold hydrolase [Candidatus Velthaea sp.]
MSGLELARVNGRRNEIAVLVYPPRRARGIGIVAAHGYSSSKQNLDLLCAFLASHGFTVYSLDLPGHKLGASGGTLRAVDDLTDAFAAAVRFARERGETTLYALGHSLGATTALYATAVDPGLAGVIAIATGYGRPQALEALRGRGVFDLRSGYVVGLSLPEIVAEWQPVLAASLPGLGARPKLFVAAERDMMVSRASVEELAARVPQPATLVTIPSDHTYAGENARNAVLTFLNALHPRSEAVLADPAAADAAL